MRAFVTLMFDVPREVLRKRSIVSLILILLMTVVCSISYRIETMSVDRYFEYTIESEITERDNLPPNLRGVAFTSGIRPVGDVVPWPSRVEGGRATTIDFTDQETRRGICKMLALRQQTEWPARSIDGRPAAEALVERTLQSQFGDVAAFVDTDDPNRLHVAIRSDQESYPGTRYTVFFDSFEEEVETDAQGQRYSPQMLVDTWFGQWMRTALITIVILVTAAGFIPQILTRGNIEPILARPVSRATVLLGTYAGTTLLAAMFYGVIAVVLFIGFSQTVATPSTGSLLAIPLYTLMFASVTAGAVLAGSLIRSNALAGMTAVGLYIFPMSIAPYRYFNMRGLDHENAEGSWVLTLLEGLWWVLPKNFELQQLSLPEHAGGMPFRADPPDPTIAIGTSIAFGAACLLLAWLRARRMEF